MLLVFGHSTVGNPEDLFECFVVDKAGGIFWNFQLPFLYMLSELPGEAC